MANPNVETDDIFGPLRMALLMPLMQSEWSSDAAKIRAVVWPVVRDWLNEITEGECLSGGDARMAAEGAPSGTFAYVEHTDGTWAPMMKQPDGRWACGQDTDGDAHRHTLDGDRIVILNDSLQRRAAGVALRPGSSRPDALDPTIEPPGGTHV